MARPIRQQDILDPGTALDDTGSAAERAARRLFLWHHGAFAGALSDFTPGDLTGLTRLGGLHTLMIAGPRAITDFDVCGQIPSLRTLLISNAKHLSTLDFLLREMQQAEAYFISSFSAVDEQGREGFYYLWDDAELDQLLNAEQLEAVRAAWFGKQTAQSLFRCDRE